MLGNPNYGLVRNLVPSEVMDMSDKELIYSYTMIKVKFAFDKDTLYPNIPCFADQTTTVYPLKGSAQLTGSVIPRLNRDGIWLVLLWSLGVWLFGCLVVWLFGCLVVWLE